MKPPVDAPTSRQSSPAGSTPSASSAVRELLAAARDVRRPRSTAARRPRRPACPACRSPGTSPAITSACACVRDSASPRSTSSDVEPLLQPWRDPPARRRSARPARGGSDPRRCGTRSAGTSSARRRALRRATSGLVSPVKSCTYFQFSSAQTVTSPTSIRHGPSSALASSSFGADRLALEQQVVDAAGGAAMYGWWPAPNGHARSPSVLGARRRRSARRRRARTRRAAAA